MSSPAPPFDPACYFLLTLRFENLFEPRYSTGYEALFTCKGCGAAVTHRERKKHYDHHKRVEQARRERETHKSKERAAAKARAAKQKKMRENGDE